MNRLEHVLATLSEECHEAGKVACKALRFGLDDRKHGEGPTNAEKLRAEVLDIIGTYQMIAMEGHALPLSICEVGTARAAKQARIESFMPHAVEKGALQL